MEDSKRINSGGYVYPFKNEGMAHASERGITRRNQLIDSLVCEISGIIFKSIEKGSTPRDIEKTIVSGIETAIKMADLTIEASK